MRVLVSMLLSVFLMHQTVAVTDLPALISPSPTAFPEYPTIYIPQNPPKEKTSTEKRDYFRTLFDEVETAKTTPTPVESVRLHDKLEKNSVAYGVLKHYPDMQTGPLEFRMLKSRTTHLKEIQQGQALILKEFGQKSRTYKQITDQIDQKLYDPNSHLTNEDWVLMANAFRTLDAPGPSHKANILGSLLAEYILLGKIKKHEMIPNPSQEEKLTLTDFYYALAQLYQIMYKNEEKVFNQPRDGQIPLLIDPVYFEGTDYGIYPVEYLIPFDYIVGNRLDLLESDLLLDPYDDLAWAQLVEFAAFDLIDPWFYDQIYPDFWYAYFPFGFRALEAERLHHKWNQIRHHKDVHHDRHLRLNHRGGPAAVSRLHRVYAHPASRLNQTITRIEKSGIHKSYAPKFKRVEREQAIHTDHRTKRSNKIYARYDHIFKEKQAKIRTHYPSERDHVFPNQPLSHSDGPIVNRGFTKQHQASSLWKERAHLTTRSTIVPQERHSFHAPRSHAATVTQNKSHSHKSTQSGVSQGDDQRPQHKRR